jgi:hypothetical protein
MFWRPRCERCENNPQLQHQGFPAFFTDAVFDHDAMAFCLSQGSLCRRACDGDADAGRSSRRYRQLDAIFTFQAADQRPRIRRNDRAKALAERWN